MKIIIFDIDGTLLLTGGVGIQAFDRVFQELFDVPKAWNDYDPHGKTDQEIINDLSRISLGREINPLEQREIGRRYIQYFSELIDIAPNFRLLSGAFELVKELSDRNYFLGIATGNFKETAEHKLRRGKLNHFFSFGGYASDSHIRLELTKKALERGLASYKNGSSRKIEPSEVILIGDAKQDMICGKTLGLRTIGVATGSLSENELLSYEPALVLKDLSDTKKILEFIES